VKAGRVILATAIGAIGSIHADTLRTHYFGNSLTAQTEPEWHDDLAAGRGDTWQTDFYGIAGGRMQQIMAGLFPEYPFGQTFPEDPTDPDHQPVVQPDWGSAALPTDSSALTARLNIESNTYDVVVIQPHVEDLYNYIDNPGAGRVFESGDVRNGGHLIEWVRHHQPEAQIYLYATWPDIPNTDGSGENIMWDDFEYSSVWNRTYDPNSVEDTIRTYDYVQQLRDVLNENHESTLGTKDVKIVPVGEVLDELHQMAQAGEIVDEFGQPLELTIHTAIVDADKQLVSIEQEVRVFDDIERFWYVDRQHQSAGWAAYLGAATQYAVQFGEMPHGLDYTLYNDWPDGYAIQSQDSRIFVELDPLLAQYTNDAIWEVVTRDSHLTGVVPEPSTALLFIGGGLLLFCLVPRRRHG